MREFVTSTVDFFFYLYTAGFASWFLPRAHKECKSRNGYVAPTDTTVKDRVTLPFPADGS